MYNWRPGLCFLDAAVLLLSDWCFSKVSSTFQSKFSNKPLSVLQNTGHAVRHSSKQTANQLLMPRGVDGCTKLLFAARLQCGSSSAMCMALCCTNCTFHLPLPLIDCKVRPSATPPRLNYSIIVTAGRNFSPQSTKQCVMLCRFAAVRCATRRFGSAVVSSVNLLKPFALMIHSSLQKVRRSPFNTTLWAREMCIKHTGGLSLRPELTVSARYVWLTRYE